MDNGELLTHWTARIAMLLYALSLALRGAAWDNRCRLNASRLTWTAGCGVYLLHVVCAFQFVHHWSHAAAYAATARQTAAVTGLNWGGGLYVNYFFTLVWVVDVLWWWLSPERYLNRSHFVEAAVQSFLGFVAFNATVVFATGITRWGGVTACVVLAMIWIRKMFHARKDTAKPANHGWHGYHGSGP